jgi:hypothetical protein
MLIVLRGRPGVGNGMTTAQMDRARGAYIMTGTATKKQKEPGDVR